VLKSWKFWAGLGMVGVGAYLAWRWYQGRRTGGLSGYPRWLGYGRAKADYSLAKAFGAQTAQTLNMEPQPVIAAGDTESAPEGVSFSEDDGEPDGEAEF
jgi:hypothetical protein